MDHGKEIRIVPPNPELADKINKIGQRLLRTKKINRYSNDAAAMCRIPMNNRAFVLTWARPTNDTIVSNARDVKAVVNVSLNQSLRAAFRKDVGRMRLCQTGLVILAHLTTESVPPFVADLIPGIERTEDFDEESGSVDIAPVIEMSHLILSNVLATSGSLVIDGKARFTALIDVIRNEGHSVKTLMETDFGRMVGEKYRTLRERTGNVETKRF